MAETFGRTVKGDTEFLGATTNIIYACKFQSGSAGELATLSFYAKQYLTVTPLVKCAIYNSDLTLMTDGTTEEKQVEADQDGWMVFNFVGTKPSVLATTNYWLAAWWSDSLTVYYSTGTTDQTLHDHQTYDGWPDPLYDYGPNYDDREQSIYATYEEAVAAKTLVQAALISIPPLIVLPTLGQILRLTGGC